MAEPEESPLVRRLLHITKALEQATEELRKIMTELRGEEDPGEK
jgi:hypothetical protein